MWDGITEQWTKGGYLQKIQRTGYLSEENREGGGPPYKHIQNMLLG
jgi:hypothetical protein